MRIKTTNTVSNAMIALCLVSAASTASAEIMSRAADGVSRILFTTPGELLVRYGAEEKLTVEAEPKVLAQMNISLKGDTLTLASKGSFKTDKPLKFTLTIKSFRSIKSDASGNAQIEGFSGTDMELEAAGSGDLGLKNIKPGKLKIALTGSGNVKATGSGKSLLASIDGSGNIDTVKFLAQAVDARIVGSGDIRVHADQTLNASISGAGNIEFEGKAKVTQSITGAGSIERL
ncbi:MAG: head GIN domain-containing protein [Pseudomonadota bacterium]